MLNYDVFCEFLPEDDYTAKDVFDFYQLFCKYFNVPSDATSLKALSSLAIYVNSCMDATISFSTKKEEDESIYFSFSNIRLRPSEVTKEHPITIQLYFEFQQLKQKNDFLLEKSKEIVQTLLQREFFSDYYMFLTYMMISGDFLCLQNKTRD